MKKQPQHFSLQHQETRLPSDPLTLSFYSKEVRLYKSIQKIETVAKPFIEHLKTLCQRLVSLYNEIKIILARGPLFANPRPIE
jgi:hypothetical protein